MIFKQLWTQFQQLVVDPQRDASCIHHNVTLAAPATSRSPMPNRVTMFVFEISVLKPEKGADFYGAVGFNNDPVMARASVIACTYDSSVAAATVSLFHNPPPQGENNHVPAQRVPFGPADPALVRLEEAAVINNRLVCRYTRNIAVPSNKQSQVYPLNAPYHILLARGQYDAKNKQLTHHDERIINAQKVDVTQPPRLI